MPEAGGFAEDEDAVRRVGLRRRGGLRRCWSLRHHAEALQRLQVFEHQGERHRPELGRHALVICCASRVPSAKFSTS
jgi:hypothetical protein